MNDGCDIFSLFLQDDEDNFVNMINQRRMVAGVEVYPDFIQEGCTTPIAIWKRSLVMCIGLTVALISSWQAVEFIKNATGIHEMNWVWKVVWVVLLLCVPSMWMYLRDMKWDCSLKDRFDSLYSENVKGGMNNEEATTKAVEEVQRERRRNTNYYPHGPHNTNYYPYGPHNNHYSENSLKFNGMGISWKKNARP